MFTLGKPLCALSWEKHEYAADDDENPWTYKNLKAAMGRCETENGTNPHTRKVSAYGKLEKV